jgi:hypothetical protein
MRLTGRLQVSTLRESAVLASTQPLSETSASWCSSVEIGAKLTNHRRAHIGSKCTMVTVSPKVRPQCAPQCAQALFLQILRRVRLGSRFVSFVLKNGLFRLVERLRNFIG